MANRIMLKPQDLLIQCQAASQAIAAAAQWPGSAPAAEQLEEDFEQLTELVQQMNLAQAALDKLRQKMHDKIAAAREDMRLVDNVTDGLFGPGDPAKYDFGLAPKKPGGRAGKPIELHQLVISEITDGVEHGSLALKFKPIKGACYQVEWFADELLKELVGNAALTDCTLQVNNLTPGKKYYFQVRPIRGKEQGPWSQLSAARCP